jgi:hypothetical protein
MTARDLAFAVCGAAAVIAACGTPGDTAHADAGTTPPDPYTDGTRIKARWSTVAFADGAKGRTFLGWWDSELKAECTPSTLSTATTGAGWCLPAAISFTAIFGDATCSTPIAAQPFGGSKAGTLGVFADVPRKLWAASEPLAIPAEVWVKDSGACVARTWSGSGAMRVSPVDLGRYAAVTIGAAP